MAHMVYDFSDLLYPHGEDSYSFEKKNRNLNIKIGYDENSKFISMVFATCDYFYAAPVPGFFPDQVFSQKMGPLTRPGCVFEFYASDFLNACAGFSASVNYKTRRRHFFIYLSSGEVIFNILAADFNITH